MMKALILASLPARARVEMLATFRGTRAHGFEWLRLQYDRAGGEVLPREVHGAFSAVSKWTTALRYVPATVGTRDAATFVTAAQRILEWADGRL
jgi:hypothetical protein